MMLIIMMNTGGSKEQAISMVGSLILYLFLSLYMISQSNFVSTLFSSKMMTTMDSLSWSLITLTLFILPTMLISNSILMLNKMFLLTINSLILILTVCFSVNNMLMYYIMFESTILPTAALIMMFGYQPERIQASVYIMMYTMIASLPLLLTILYHKENMDFFMIYPQVLKSSNVMMWAMILAFLVKTPIYLSHMWLPKAHVEAPVSGSIILAGILLKLGIYAIMRLIMMHYTFLKMMLSVMILAVWGSCLASFVCLRQTDMKCLIANSSVAHMGMGLMGTIMNTTRGWVGATLLLVSHGLVSSTLFFLGGAYYQTTKTRSMSLMVGMHLITPLLTTYWCLAMISNSSIPPTLNMLGELLLIMSIYSLSKKWMLQIMLLSMLSLLYSTYMFISMHHGEVSKTKLTQTPKMNHLISLLLLLPIIILTPPHTMMTNFMA